MPASPAPALWFRGLGLCVKWGSSLGGQPGSSRLPRSPARGRPGLPDCGQARERAAGGSEGRGMSPATHPRRPERGAAAEREAANRPRAPLPSNWRRRRPARSPRPAGEPRAGGRAVRLGPARGRVCSRAPGSVLARVRGAPERRAGWCWAGQVPRGAGTRPIPASPGRPGRSCVPHPGRGPPSAPSVGPGRCCGRRGPRGVARGAELRARPPGG